MAERRMFAKSIIDSDVFLDMPTSTQLLYFHLGMRADDDGFVNNPKRIQRMINVSEDDLKILVAKKFIIPFESGVVVIRHWRIHNYIRKDMYHETNCVVEKKLLNSGDDGYSLRTCNELVTKPSTQVRLGKVRLGKDRLGKDNIIDTKPSKKTFSEFVSMTEEEHQKLVNEFGEENTKEIIEILNNYKGANGKTYKSDYLAIRNWVVKRWKDEHRESKPVAKSFKQQEHDDFMAYVEEMAQKGKYVP